MSVIKYYTDLYNLLNTTSTDSYIVQFVCAFFGIIMNSLGLRVAIRPALGRTVRFFKALSGVRRSIKPDAYLSSF